MERQPYHWTGITGQPTSAGARLQSFALSITVGLLLVISVLVGLLGALLVLAPIR